MRPHKGFRGYDGFFDPDNSDYANLMADYGHLFQDKDKKNNVEHPVSVVTTGNNRNGRYYPRFTVKKLLKWWLISVVSCGVIFVMKLLFVQIFVI